MERKNLLIGARITIPTPEEDDTWSSPMIADVEDILDDDTIIFLDDEYDSHQIEISRILLYTA